MQSFEAWASRVATAKGLVTLGFCIGERYDLNPAAHDYAETIGSRSVEVECANLSGAEVLNRMRLCQSKIMNAGETCDLARSTAADKFGLLLERHIWHWFDDGALLPKSGTSIAHQKTLNISP